MNAPNDPARPRGLPIAEAIGTRRLVIAIVTMPIVAILATALIILYAKGRSKPAPAAAAVEPALMVPAGGRIAETWTDGRRLVVRIETADGGGSIVVYDIGTGRRLRTIDIRAAAAGR